MKQFDLPIVPILHHVTGMTQRLLTVYDAHLICTTSDAMFIDLVSASGAAKLAIICIGHLSNGAIDKLITMIRGANSGIPIIIRYLSDDGRISRGSFVEHENVFHVQEGNERETTQQLLAA